jgi:hypothetical protein
VVVKRPRQWGRSGVQHQRAGLVRVHQLAGYDGVRRVAGDRGEGGAELFVNLIQRSGVAGDADYVRAGLCEGGGDAAAEATASAGHDRRRP